MIEYRPIATKKSMAYSALGYLPFGITRTIKRPIPPTMKGTITYIDRDLARSDKKAVRRSAMTAEK
jgi:hypothetical protein